MNLCNFQNYHFQDHFISQLLESSFHFCAFTFLRLSLLKVPIKSVLNWVDLILLSKLVRHLCTKLVQARRNRFTKRAYAVCMHKRLPFAGQAVTKVLMTLARDASLRLRNTRALHIVWQCSSAGDSSSGAYVVCFPKSANYCHGVPVFSNQGRAFHQEFDRRFPPQLMIICVLK